ncbi:MAG TPA: acyl-CoA dehydrogenase [Acidimicrobiales bacterium]|nr:acyl-CoA dehydrogenase [Acidimicrobiales bacterium]
MSSNEAAAGGDLLAYRAPVADILDALDVTGLDEVLALPAFAHVDRTAVADVVGEFGRFAGDVVAPTDRPGDLDGARLDPATGTVHAPAAFGPAYRQFVAAGWEAVSAPTAHGGGGFPAGVGMALQEMLASANLSLSLNPVLTQSAIELLSTWGTPDQQARFLPRLVVGEWTGTMNLTEPDAGSDLGEVRTRAEQGPDGRWRVTGTKIFITWGDHDLADNVVHLVLARTPGAPPGTKGLSLFLVPKVLVGPDGALGARNAVRCVGLEHKLGIHGSPTCVMSYDGADAELVGEQHGGITAMFVMMNAARLAIGMEGPAVAERAFQHAYRYAAGRLQGRAPGVSPPARSPIVDHPDVRRLLLSMRTTTLAGRMLVYLATHHRDLARHHPDPAARAAAQGLVDLLTPVAKAWPTDAGIAAASAGLQVLGGAGYIEEAGMAQRLRDSRITAVYEGTNGIQAIDLVTRKLPGGGGRTVRDLIGAVARTAAEPPPANGSLDATHDCLAEAAAVLDDVTGRLPARSPRDVLAGASAYLELFGLTVAGWLMLRRARQAAAGAGWAATADAGRQADAVAGGVDPVVAALESEFFATEHTARAVGLARPVLAGARRLDALSSRPA